MAHVLFNELIATDFCLSNGEVNLDILETSDGHCFHGYFYQS
jgi:hypothetical protein